MFAYCTSDRLYDGVDDRGDAFLRLQAQPHGGDDDPPAFDEGARRVRQGHVPQPRQGGEFIVRDVLARV